MKSSDCFRSVSDVFEPDSRNLAAPKTFGGQPKSVDEYHKWISEFELPPECPDDIRIQFDLARNLYVYAWYVLRFTSAAQAQAYASLELALRTRMEEVNIDVPKPLGLFNLLNVAVKNNLLRDAGFPHLKYSPRATTLDPEGTEYCRELPKTISMFRNSYAHGETTLLNLPVSIMALESTWAVIHQLYGETGPETKE